MKSLYFSVFLLAVRYYHFAEASVTPRRPQKPVPVLNSTLDSFGLDFSPLERRQNALKVSTCGFGSGRADRPRTADPGFDCRVDTKNAIWGFCPTTVIVASDCGLAGACVDNHGCSTGCGIRSVNSITTFTCTGSGSDFCSTAILIAGPDQTYSYLACANAAITETLMAVATTTPSSAVSTTSPTAAPAATSRVTVTETPTPASSSSTRSSPSPSPSSGLITSTTSTTPSSGSDTARSTQSGTQSPFTSTTLISSTSTSNPQITSSSSNNIGAIVGGVIGGAALISFVVLGVMLLRKFKRGQEPKASESTTQFSNPSLVEKDGTEMFTYPYSKRHTPIEMPTQKPNRLYELPS